MSRVRKLIARLVALFRRGASDRELEQEIAAHLAMIEEGFRAAGFGDEDARFAARREFGNVEQTKQDHRNNRSFLWLEQALQDARHAWRSLRRNPALVTIAIVSVTLGVGANTAIFSLVEGVLLRRLPIDGSTRVVQLQGLAKEPSFSATPFFSYPQFLELRRLTSIFSDVVAVSDAPAIVESESDSKRIDLEFITGSYFPFFEGRPEIGRLLNEDDDAVAGKHRVCVLSEKAWRSYFGGDPQILGRFIRINSLQVQVVGIAARHFAGASLQRSYDIWVPTSMLRVLMNEDRDNPISTGFRILAKVRPGISESAARTRLAAASKAIEAALPTQRVNKDQTYGFQDGSRGLDEWRRELHRPLLVLMATVGVLLLIACSNLAGLLLIRANERQPEFALKLTLGVSRWRLARQLLIESLLLMLGGAISGIWTASLLLKVLLNFFNTGRTDPLHVAMSASVMWLTFAGCLLTGIIVGAGPSWFASRSGTAPELKRLARQSRAGGKTRRILIVSQVALSITLLLAALLFERSLQNLRAVNLGYDVDRLTIVTLVPRRIQDAPQGGPPMVQLASGFREFVSRIKQSPAVISAAFSFPGVLQGFGMRGPVETRASMGAGARRIDCSAMLASPRYFSTVRISLLQGREFSDSDRVGAPLVAIVNQRAAKLLWPGEAPLGKRFDSPIAKGLEVVGVVQNSTYQNVRDGIEPIVYMSAYQMPVMSASLVVRANDGTAKIESEVEKLLRSSALSFRVSNAETIKSVLDGQLAQDRLLSLLSTVFGALGITMALIGVYGLIAHAVATRIHEIGIRTSVGATRLDILLLLLREATAVLALGILIGLPFAAFLGRAFRGLLYHVRAADWRLFAAVVCLMFAAGLIAALLPAIRAMRVNPVEALRYE